MSKRDLLGSKATTLEEQTERHYNTRARIKAELLSEMQAPDNALVRRDDGTLTYGDIQLTRIGIKFIEDLDLERWERLATMIGAANESMAWWIGDLFAYGERAGYGEAKEIAARYGYEPSTVYNFAWVARSVEFSLRREVLSFGHHKLVARMKPDEQRYCLIEADAGDWSVARLRAEIRGTVAQEVDSPSVQAFDRTVAAFHKMDDYDRRDYIMKLRAWLDGLEG